MSLESAATEVEDLVTGSYSGSSSSGLSVISDIANLHGAFSNPISVEFTAIRKKLPDLFSGNSATVENPDYTTTSLTFIRKNGGLVWEPEEAPEKNAPQNSSQQSSY